VRWQAIDTPSSTSLGGSIVGPLGLVVAAMVYGRLEEASRNSHANCSIPYMGVADFESLSSVGWGLESMIVSSVTDVLGL